MKPFYHSNSFYEILTGGNLFDDLSTIYHPLVIYSHNSIDFENLPAANNFLWIGTQIIFPETGPYKVKTFESSTLINCWVTEKQESYKTF